MIINVVKIKDECLSNIYLKDVVYMKLKKIIVIIIAIALFCSTTPQICEVNAMENASTDIKIKNVSIGGFWAAYHMAAVTEGGDLYCWGFNEYGQVGNGTTIDQTKPEKVLSNVKDVELGLLSSAAITEEGDLYCWGEDYNDEGVGGAIILKPEKVLSNVKDVELGQLYIAAITEEGDLYCWGANSYGQIGNGTTITQITPVKVLSNVKSVSLGATHSAAITEEGDLYCWGANENGQVGDGTNIDRLTPEKIMSNVKSVSLHAANSAAITEEGDLYCWGLNKDGQIGDGKEISSNPFIQKNQNVPLKVLSNVKEVSIGGMGTGVDIHSAAVTEEGDLYCWGANENGQAGNEKNMDQSTPEKIMSNVKSVSLGKYNYNGMAITEEDDLYCWGYNENGQVGNGTKTRQNTPVKILSNTKSAFSYGYNSTALTKDGELYCWGYNRQGQVGDGTYTERNVPVKIFGKEAIDIQDFMYCDNGDGTCKIYDYIGTSEKVIIPESINGLTVTEIYSGAFGSIDLGENGGISDSKITSISIPKTITSIGDFVFKNCSSLKEIKVDTQNTEYKTIDGVLYTSDGTVLICCPAKRARSSISISENVKEIKAYAFNFVTNLKDVYYEGNRFTLRAILIGESNEAIKKANLYYGKEVDWGSDFTLGKDNNSYGHYPTNGGIDKYGRCLNNAGFVGVKNNDITRESYKKLIVNATLPEKARIIIAAKKHWDGSCYGIAATMCLNYSNELGLNSLFENNNSYYDMELPYTNPNFINTINYYHLTQQLSNYGVKSNSYFTCDLHNSKKTMRLSTFLEKLVNVCQNEETAIFGMLIKGSGGHAIVACGCYTDKANDRYIIRLYDENSIISKDDIGDYAYMEIPMDFSDYRVYGDITVKKEDFKLLYCVDICNNSTISTPFSNIMTMNATQDQKKMYVSVDASSAFKLVNDKGESLEYDGTYYSGNMEVYNIQPIVNTTEASCVYEIDYSNNITYISSSEEDSFDVYDDESYYAVESTGMDTAYIDLNQGISLSGNDINFNVVAGNENSEKAAITEVSGKAVDDVSINDKEGIKINSKNVIENVSIIETDIEQSRAVIENKEGSSIEYSDGIVIIDGNRQVEEERPTVKPTITPTIIPSETPTSKPTVIPTITPSAEPIEEPQKIPTETPTIMPTSSPAAETTEEPNQSNKPYVPTQVPTPPQENAGNNPTGGNINNVLDISKTDIGTQTETQPTDANKKQTTDSIVAKTLKLKGVKCIAGSKKITGKISVSKAKVKIKVGSKAYKKAAIKGKKFKIVLGYKLRKNTKVTIKVTKKGYKGIKKILKVK